MASNEKVIAGWRQHHSDVSKGHVRMHNFYRRLAHVSHFSGASLRTTIHLYAMSKHHARMARMHRSLSRSRRVHINRRENTITAPVAGGGIHRDRLGRFSSGGAAW